ncbi:MAG: SRPBCC family protein, partial [Thermoleophilaceae bacterium]
MPRVTRRRRIEAPPDRIWEVISDSHSLPRWWPRLQRVEEATETSWTKVLTSDRGKPIRADFTRTAAEPPDRLEWQQELVETPFERILSESKLTIALEGENGSTEVSMRSKERLRGLARLGSVMVRR